jgi:hypothetical protein
MYLNSFSQPSDIISVRKGNGNIVKTFIASSPIIFETKSGMYVNGIIKQIKNDSVFVTTYDIRIFQTNLGVTMVDTIARHIAGIHYKDILKIKVFRRHRFIRGKIDKLLMYGGAGYFGLNIINGSYFNQPITDKKNLRSLSISLGAFGAGLIINKFFPVNRFSRKRHKIVYISMR